MVSKTKYEISNQTIKKLFEKAKITDIVHISPLGAGEFNAVFCVKTKSKEYALKIAPTDEAPTMTYEKNMMETEVFWYEKMREHTSINVPKIYFTDYSKDLIPTNYFIMEKLPGETLDKMKLSKQEKQQSQAKLAEMVAQIHKVKGERFGYIQNGLHDNWYQAIRSMVIAILEDCSKKGKRSKKGELLLKHIDENKALLEKSECCMVNFDIWEPNIICKRENNSIKYSWIDPERGFWGDPIVDFVCLEMTNPLADKKISLKAYNEVADSPVSATKEEQIRYAIAQGYLGVLMEVERYFRYTPHHFGWWRNVFASKWLFASAFRGLKHD